MASAGPSTVRASSLTGNEPFWRTAEVVKFFNCRVFKGRVRTDSQGTEHEAYVLEKEDVWVKQGVVIDPAVRFWEAQVAEVYACDIAIDCDGKVLAPGFLDIQFNGAYGVDFAAHDVTAEDYLAVCRQLLQFGVTGICPTVVSSSTETYAGSLAAYLQAKALLNQQEVEEADAAGTESKASGAGAAAAGKPACLAGSRMLGLHLEGPFIAQQFKGAHSAAHLRVPLPAPLQLSETQSSSNGGTGAGENAASAEIKSVAVPSISSSKEDGLAGKVAAVPVESADAVASLSLSGLSIHLHQLQGAGVAADAAALSEGDGFSSAVQTPFAEVSTGAGKAGAAATGSTSSSSTPSSLPPTSACFASLIQSQEEEAVAGQLSAVYGPLFWPAVEKGDVTIITLAPELPGALTATALLSRAGVTVSIGHTAAGIRAADAAVSKGARCITHLYNAMQSFHHRDPGTVGLLGRKFKLKPEGKQGGSEKEGKVRGAEAAAHTGLAGFSLDGRGHSSTLSPESSPIVLGASAGCRSCSCDSNPAAASPRLTGGRQSSGNGSRDSSSHQHHHHRSELAAAPIAPPVWDIPLHLLMSKSGVKQLADEVTPFSDPLRGRQRRLGWAGREREGAGCSCSCSCHGGDRGRSGEQETGARSQRSFIAAAESFYKGHSSSSSSSAPAASLSLPSASRPFYGLILDGVHVHPYACCVAFSTHPHGLICVTDAMKAMGLPPGRHTLGDLQVEIFYGLEDGHYEGLHAVLADTSTLAGAVVPLDTCLRNLRSFTRCSLAESLATATVHAAQLLGLYGRLGCLLPGAWADMVLLDDDLRVHQTYLAGKLAFCRGQERVGELAAVRKGGGAEAGAGGGAGGT